MESTYVRNKRSRTLNPLQFGHSLNLKPVSRMEEEPTMWDEMRTEEELSCICFMWDETGILFVLFSFLDEYAKEFGININNNLTSVEARILPPPWLKYHDTGKERNCLPKVGQWNMMNKKMVNGGVITNWACINFSRSIQSGLATQFCTELAHMCQISGMQFSPQPLLPVTFGRPDQVDKALRHTNITRLQKYSNLRIKDLIY